MKLVKGFEPPTYGLQIRCSTVELHQRLYESDLDRILRHIHYTKTSVANPSLLVNRIRKIFSFVSKSKALYQFFNTV